MNKELLGELMRKSTHIGALAVPIMFVLLEREAALWIVTGAALIALTQDLLRIYHPAARKVIYRFWGYIYRRWELKRLSGASYILIAAALSLFLFEKHIAALVMVYIIVGDTAAVFIGKMWGRHLIYSRRNPDGTVRKKTLEGTLAFLLSTIVAALFMPQVPLLWKMLGALMATLVELLSFFIDDNFSVPFVVGLILQLAIYGDVVAAV